MVFQFEHICLDQQEGMEKWDLKPLQIKELKRVIAKWQTALGKKDGIVYSGTIMTSHVLSLGGEMINSTIPKVLKC